MPLFRKIPLLAERSWAASCRCGRWNWRGQFDLPALPAAADPPSPQVAPALPPDLALASRAECPHQPLPQRLLKARRAVGAEGGHFVTVPYPGIPAAEVDRRKWGDVSLQALTLEEALALPADALGLPGHPAGCAGSGGSGGARWPGPCRAGAERILALSVELMPASMPAHWVFTYFPEAWAQARAAGWTPRTRSYGVLRENGFGLVLQEHAFDQPVSLAAAYALAGRRAGILATLADDAYQKGHGAAAPRRCNAQGRSDTLIGSEVTLVEGGGGQGMSNRGPSAASGRSILRPAGPDPSAAEAE